MKKSEINDIKRNISISDLKQEDLNLKQKMMNSPNTNFIESK